MENLTSDKLTDILKYVGGSRLGDRLIDLRGPFLIPDSNTVFVWWWAGTKLGDPFIACGTFVYSGLEIAAMRKLGDLNRALAAFRDCVRLFSKEYSGRPEAELTAVDWIEEGDTIPMPDLTKIKEGAVGGPDQSEQ